MRKRHTFVRFISTVYIFISALMSLNAFAQSVDPWMEVEKIVSKIRPPVFPDNDFVITKYGAIGDGITNCSKAIKDAIKACNKKGGGRVVIPAGNYCTGPIYLKSNVNLHLERGATLLFSTNPDDYLPLVYTRWEGIELMNYSPLIYAFNEKNIAITGEGILNGQGSNKHWWAWKGRANYGWIKGTPNQTDSSNRPALFAMAEIDKPVTERKFGNGFYLRPQFIQPYNCKNILIEGITITNSPMWILHPVLCTNVTISKVKVESDGPNSDGCDPESCKDVLIKDCYFDTGDDCIAIKSGRNRDGRRINEPSENIIVRNCTMVNGHAGIGIGSEISGGVRNLFFENCKINNTMWGVRIKTSSMRGGTNKNIYIRNIDVEKTRNEAINITMLYEDKGPNMPVLRDIEIQNVNIVKGGKMGLLIEGYPESPVQNIKFTDVHISDVEKTSKITNTINLTFSNCTINGQKIE